MSGEPINSINSSKLPMVIAVAKSLFIMDIPDVIWSTCQRTLKRFDIAETDGYLAFFPSL